MILLEKFNSAPIRIIRGPDKWNFFLALAEEFCANGALIPRSVLFWYFDEKEDMEEALHVVIILIARKFGDNQAGFSLTQEDDTWEFEGMLPTPVGRWKVNGEYSPTKKQGWLQITGTVTSTAPSTSVSCGITANPKVQTRQ